MNLLRTTLTAFFCAIQFLLVAQLYTFRNYNHRDGLVMESTLSAAQDSKGNLWIGTDGAGLMRFDGYHFYEVKSKHNNGQHHVSSIYPDANGTVYFTSSYSGLYKYENNDYRLVYQSDAIEDAECHHVSMVDSSLVLICQKSVTLLSQSGKVIRRVTMKSPNGLVIHQVLKIPQGVFIFTGSGNFFVRSGKIIRLNNWYSDYANDSFKPVFGTFLQNRLVLYTSDLKQQLKLELSNDGSVFSGKLQSTNLGDKLSEGDKVLSVCERRNVGYFCTESQKLYRFENGKVQRVVQNYSGKIYSFDGISIDQNNDLWINSSYGLFKVSIEPFTRVELNPIYEDHSISVIHRTKAGKIIVGTNESLKIGELYSDAPVQVYNYKAFQVAETPQGIFIATEVGIMELKGSSVVATSFPYQSGKSITLMHWDGESFWYSLRGEGLVQYNVATKQAKRYLPKEVTFASHFYTAQNNFDQSVVYFGSNDGVYAYDKKTKKISFLKAFRSLGSYSGVSTRDRFGTCWFSLDKGLAGITNRGEYVRIDDPDKLPSTLFYTLSSDNYGNLLVGTNKGINIIEVNANGQVVLQNNYTFKEGFGGYETHMRSQFQSGNSCFVGTIEGLYLINTEVLRSFPPPPKPVILFGTENEHGELVQFRDKSLYTFKCLLPKSEAILFSYRIKGYQNKWSNFSFDHEVDLPELPNGTYQLEVRASYDGITVSEISSYPIVIDIPIWRTKWFIVVLVIILGILNTAYLEWSKSYVSNNLFDTKEVMVDIKMVPRIIAFGFFLNMIMLFIVNLVDKTFVDTAWLNTIFSSLMFLLVVLSNYYKSRKGSRVKMTRIFYVTYFVFMLEYFYLAFISNLHPFPLIAIILGTSVVPFVISNIRFVIFATMLQLISGTIMLLWLEDTVYNEILFVSAIAVSGGIGVMATYLRNNSLEKLIFVSGVINKGNVLAISFDQRGLITYCSENINDFFAVDFSAIVGKPVSILNPFVAETKMREISLRDEFEDGRIFLIPMYNKHNEVSWIEWSCKYFNDSVKVIMGHDVTDKLIISTNYQSLVENAQDMIYHTDIDGNFIFANERCVQLFGYRNETIIGKNSIALIAPDHRDRVKQFYEDQFSNRLHHTYLEFPIKSRDGRVFWVGQNVTMLYEPGSRKRVSGFIALARDITEKRANDLLIEQQNKDITSSINSAKRIQFNLLPDPQVFNRYFEQSFTLFKPKDIVSGDFYWVEEIDDKLIVVLADCTGHGVPGAFMTILGINLLNQIVRERKQCDPDIILNQLNRELEWILQKNEGSVMFDSMETLVCVFEQGEMCYASSGVSFIHQRNGELNVYRTTKTASETDESTTFEKVCLKFDAADSFYLFTDGYQKQFGSIRNKKFGFKRILELLQQIHIESMPLQKKYFENAWRNWSEAHEQTDDITVVGLKELKIRKAETNEKPVSLGNTPEEKP